MSARTQGFAIAVSTLLIVVRARADGPPPPGDRQAPSAGDERPRIEGRSLPPPLVLSTEALEDDERGDDVMDPRPWHGAYGAPSLKVTTLAGEAVTLLGGEGSWIIGHALAIGGAGYASVTRIGSPGALQPAEGGARIGIGYGGVRLGGIVGTRRLTHLTFGILVGAGSATSATASGSFHRADGVFVAEPDVGTEINLARHFRVGVVGSYRFIGSTDIAGFTPTRLSGPAAAVTLRFGAF